MRRALLLGTMIVLATALWGCGRGEAETEGKTVATVKRGRVVVWVGARGKLMAESNVTVAPPRYWRLKVSKIVAKEGDKVKKGDVLLELDTQELEEQLRDLKRDIGSSEGYQASAQAQLKSERERLDAELARAREDLAKAQKALEELRKVPLPVDLRNAEIDRETAKKTAEQAEVRYRNMKKLYESVGGVSLQQLEQRELEYHSAETNLRKAELNLQLVKDGPLPEVRRDAEISVELAGLAVTQAGRTRELTLAQLDESLKKAEAQVKLNKVNQARLQKIMEECTVRVPVDGTVFYRRLWSSEGQEKLKEGMEVRPWTRLIDLPDTNRMQILVEVEEPVIGKVGPEQPARVTLDAYRDKPFTGKVTRIDARTRTKSQRQTQSDTDKREDLGIKIVEVIISLNETDPLLRTGLNGKAEIRTSHETEGLLIPLKALFTGGGRDVVYLVQGGSLVERPVKIGEHSDEDVLILEGLKEGDRVSLVPPKRSSGEKGRAS
jgi:multidrug efflux pump subunit AcrA (membrane-fusion protein)